MSLYQRYAGGEVKKTSFTLTKDNIGFYRDQCNKMDEELRNLRSYIEIVDKLNNADKQDYLFTPEYLNRRLEKLQSRLVLDENSEKFIEAKKELDSVNDEIKIVFPQAMDKELGKDPAIHERMSVLNDRRKELEDEMVEVFSQKYRDLRANLPKIFLMIIEGVDMETVGRCFSNMTAVLSDEISIEEGAEDMMRFSEAKYNLPSTMYDPIRNKRNSKRKNNK